mmetsp:Transcript_44106/g.172054  ORF Transcript_44106/g.172054 Transcript_44106/m.172054 type:complete len:81 (+) Transcript_44106:410-652(+)
MRPASGHAHWPGRSDDFPVSTAPAQRRASWKTPYAAEKTSRANWPTAGRKYPQPWGGDIDNDIRRPGNSSAAGFQMRPLD